MNFFIYFNSTLIIHYRTPTHFWAPNIIISKTNKDEDSRGFVNKYFAYDVFS